MASALPVDLAAERWVLGAAMKRPELAHEFEAAPGDFHHEPHRHVWAAVLSVLAEGKTPDVVTVGRALQREKVLEVVGGPVFLGDLMNDVGTTIGWESRLSIVLEHAGRRRLIQAGTDIAAKGYDLSVPIEDLHGFAERSIYSAAAQNADSARWVHAADTLAGAVLDEMEAVKRGERTPGVPTGYDAVDRVLVMGKTDLIVLAGRPGMGKTAFGLGVATNVADAGTPAAVFSLEMAAKQQTHRIISRRSGVELKRLRSAERLSRDEHQRVMEAFAWFSALPLTIIDRPALTPGQLRTECRRLYMRGRLGFAMVDYLQLMTGDGKGREEQVASCSRMGKSVAMEFDIPVLALSQLNRGVEQRQDKRPQLSDLRESGAIEQDADAVVFVYRDEYYYPDSDAKGMGEVIVSKQRNSGTGTAYLGWHAPTASYRGGAR